MDTKSTNSSNLSETIFPCFGFVKIDGVYARNIAGKLVGKDGKPFKNKANSEFFSDPRFAGFEGVMVTTHISGPGIRDKVTSLLSTADSVVKTRWCLFDYCEEGMEDMPFFRRYYSLEDFVYKLCVLDPKLKHRLWVIPYLRVNRLSRLKALEEGRYERGFAGIVLRDPVGKYGFGMKVIKP
jgi:hypothetical protein